MSIGSDEKLHGVAFLRLFSDLGKEVPQCRFSFEKGAARNAFVLRGQVPKFLGKGRACNVGLYIKVSHMRRSPWRYNFQKSHQDEILSMKRSLSAAFVVLIAGDDGICCLNFEELKQMLDHHHEDQEWMSLSRKHGQNFRVRGKDSLDDLVISRSSFPNKISAYFKEQLLK